MERRIFHHRLVDQAPEKFCDRAFGRKGGSIMIWTVMLGLLLTSVFFFFSMRQRTMLAVQRDTAMIQNAKLLLGSYADYLEKHPSESPTAIEGVDVKLTKNVEFIENAVDFGEGKRQEYVFGGPLSIFVEWNRCDEAGVPDSSGDLVVEDEIYPHQTATVCGTGEEYDDVIGPISVASPYAIETLNSPFYFRIKSASGAKLTDNRWHMELSKNLDYGKKVVIRKTFPALP